MPTTRRSTGGARALPGPAKGQSIISFSGKVTKSISQEAKKAVISPAVAQIATPANVAPTKVDVRDDAVDELTAQEEADVKPQEEEVEVAEKSEAELWAEKISNAQISSYWKSVESQRKAPRVHQQGLGVSEKVLRYFDMSSQYGPCVGINRSKRWQRAERLGLNPPIEVLAVLLAEEKKNTAETETAHMDQVLNSFVSDDA